MPAPTAAFQEPVLAWFDASKRDLPWRRARDPYAIWVSEIMLQQTQVATVLPYYERWMARFPTVASLAAADDQAVLSMWQGLGYYRRCRHLLEGARWVVQHGMPETAAGWLKVPGVGRYTAGAIASIAFGEAAPLVDGNVERVFARVTGCGLSGTALHKAAWRWAAERVPQDRPGAWNEALMELGATICRPAEPLCGQCPARPECVAHRTGQESTLPVREIQRTVVEMCHVVWVPFHDGRFGLRQVPYGQWWAGMWEFPRGGSEEEVRAIVGDGWPEELGTVRHAVTHHRIRLEASLVRLDVEAPGLRWLPLSALDDLPMPAPQRRVLGLAVRHLGLGAVGQR